MVSRMRLIENDSQGWTDFLSRPYLDATHWGMDYPVSRKFLSTWLFRICYALFVVHFKYKEADTYQHTIDPLGLSEPGRIIQLCRSKDLPTNKTNR